MILQQWERDVNLRISFVNVNRNIGKIVHLQGGSRRMAFSPFFCLSLSLSHTLSHSLSLFPSGNIMLYPCSHLVRCNLQERSCADRGRGCDALKKKDRHPGRQGAHSQHGLVRSTPIVLHDSADSHIIFHSHRYTGVTRSLVQ